MLTPIDTRETLPLTFATNSFTIQLSDLEVETYRRRMVPEMLYALVYRKGSDPRQVKEVFNLNIPEIADVFPECDTCGLCECSCERKEPVEVCCPTTFLWYQSCRSGISYTFVLDERAFLWMKPGTYVVDIFQSTELPLTTNIVDGKWVCEDVALTQPNCCCPEQLKKTCLSFEYVISDCQEMTIDYSCAGINEPLLLDLPVCKIEMEGCGCVAPSIDCCDEENCGCATSSADCSCGTPNCGCTSADDCDEVGSQGLITDWDNV